MAGKLNRYNLDGGVNVSVAPTHIDDSQLTVAQNAQFDLMGVIRKRDGHTLYASNLGNVRGIENIPLADPSTLTRTLHAGVQNLILPVTRGWRSATDGITWVDVASTGAGNGKPQQPAQTLKFPNLDPGLLLQRAVSLDGTLYYPDNNYTLEDGIVTNSTPPIIRAYSGATGKDSAFVAVPQNALAPANHQNAMHLLDMLHYGGFIYFGARYVAGASFKKGAIFRLDPSSGNMLQIGNSFGGDTTGEQAGGMPLALGTYLGQLWVGTYNIAGSGTGYVHFINPGFDTTWTQDQSFVTSYVTSIIQFQGNLYVALQGNNSVLASVIKKRTSAGVWSTVETGTSSTIYGPLTVHNGTLLAGMFDGTATCKIRKTTDGTTWADEYDVKATLGGGTKTSNFGQVTIRSDGDLWWVLPADTGTSPRFPIILKRTAAGVWSKVDDLSGSNDSFRSYLGYIEVPA